MVEPIRITEEMKDDRQKKIDEYVEKINGKIEDAIAEGKNSAWFVISPYYRAQSPYFDEVKEIFESAGYKVRPTGYRGGVWQKSYHVEW